MERAGCTAEERHVLDTVKAWPGYHVTICWSEDRGWSVTTPALEIERHDASIAERLRLMEEGMMQLYGRVRQMWEKHSANILDSRCGYSILGSRPILNTPLLIIGLNPGYGASDEALNAHDVIQETWPSHNYFEDDRFKLKDRLEDLLSSDGWCQRKSLAVATNFLFFRSRSIAGKDFAWRSVAAPLRQRLETFCLEELRRLIDLLNPRNILVLSMGAVDQHVEQAHAVLKDKSGNWLVAQGTLAGRPAIGLKHPTGARWLQQDWDAAKLWFTQHPPA